MITPFLNNQNERLSRPGAQDWPLSWLIALSGNAVEFALRNTIASLVALAIACWMEWGSPMGSLLVVRHEWQQNQV